MRKPADTSKYYITYKIDSHPEGLSAEEVLKDPETGGAHDVLLVSMMHQPDGGLSVIQVDRSHDGTPLAPLEVFKAIVVIMPSLTEELPDGSWQRFVAQAFVDFVRKVMTADHEAMGHAFAHKKEKDDGT